MRRKNSHLTDEDLLRLADGELSMPRSAGVRGHLTACWECRARMAEVEATIANFVRAERKNLDPQLPPIDGPRALLQARLAEMEAQSRGRSWQDLLQFDGSIRAFACVSALIFVAIFLGKFAFQFVSSNSLQIENGSVLTAFDRAVEPDRKLTPGATRAVAIADVCSLAHEEVVREVPMPLREAILREYGVAIARANDYEIDYLIAPGLGGTDDVRNLWPEPYKSAIWNARVKDDLEEYLHQMVCAGKLDLTTAQRDIATDWIGAYKKYFHTDRPLSLSSELMR